MITGNMLIMFIVGFIIFCFYIAGLIYAIYWGHSTQRQEMLNDPELRDYYDYLVLRKSSKFPASLNTQLYELFCVNKMILRFWA